MFKSESEIYSLIKKLYPICRSITGDGVRETLQIIQEIIPIEIKEIPTGTKVLDWEIPKEWNIKEAFIQDRAGNKIIDFQNNNLHVVSYSQPVNKKISFNDLQNHLFTNSINQDWIPYRTTYYKEDWGFCLSQNDLNNMKEKEYHVLIDAEFKEGSLSYGEIYMKGESDEEILISTHICHPSMCNDNLSGISVATYLAKYLLSTKSKYSYRIIFIPATIGAITWLAINENNLSKIKHGLVLSLLGDQGKFNYKKSRNENAEINKFVELVLRENEKDYNILEFEPYGYDERQFCSPGFNLPVGRLTRTPNQEFPEYHTSADNLDFIKSESLERSFELIKAIIKIIENNQKYLNLYPKGEPQLGRRGLYNAVAGNIKEIELALLWILSYSDGNNDLVEISNKSKISFTTILEAANLLLDKNLIKKAK